MTAWRKLFIISVALAATVAAVGSGSSDGGSGSSKSSDTSASSSSGGDSASSGSSSAGDANEVKDVTITACEKDDAGFATAKLKITNSSSKASDYIIEVTFASKDGKTQVGTGNALVSNLAPGQTKNDEANSLEQTDIEFVCTVSKVDRTASL